MAKLHQILPARKAAGDVAHETITRVHHKLTAAATSGISRVYTPKDDDGDRYPSEYQKVTWAGDDAVREALPHQVRLIDLTAQRDFTNMTACANVTVDGEVILRDAPVSFLMWLESQLTHYITFLKQLPVLDPSTNWAWSPEQGAYASDVVSTAKSRKLEVPLVLHPPTDKHPAQVKTTMIDEFQGTWQTTRFSGAFRRDDVEAALERARKLHDAVRSAASLANETPVNTLHPGQAIVDYVFEGLLHN